MHVTEFLANVESFDSDSGTQLVFFFFLYCFLLLGIILGAIIMTDDWIRLHAVVHSPAREVCLACWEPNGDSVLLQLVGAKTHQKMTPQRSKIVNRTQN